MRWPPASPCNVTPRNLGRSVIFAPTTGASLSAFQTESRSDGTMAGVSRAPRPAPPTLPESDLRRAPSHAALAVLCAAIQPGGRVGTVRRLRGGIASGMHAVDLVGP